MILPQQNMTQPPMMQQQMMQQPYPMAQNMGSAAMAAQAAAPMSPNKDLPTSTQATLLISELRDNVVIMKDGSFRAVVACKSINFDLMSDVEREAVEYSYQNFLNSLKFTTQILIRSQRVDIGPYIEKLTEIRRNNDNMLLGVLMDDYINFIDVLSQEANINIHAEEHASILDDILYYTYDRNLYAVDINTGQKLMDIELPKCYQAGPTSSVYKNAKGEKFVIVSSTNCTYCYPGL